MKKLVGGKAEETAEVVAICPLCDRGVIIHFDSQMSGYTCDCGDAICDMGGDWWVRAAYLISLGGEMRALNPEFADEMEKTAGMIIKKKGGN